MAVLPGYVDLNGYITARRADSFRYLQQKSNLTLQVQYRFAPQQDPRPPMVQGAPPRATIQLDAVLFGLSTAPLSMTVDVDLGWGTSDPTRDYRFTDAVDNLVTNAVAHIRQLARWAGQQSV